MPSNIDGGAIPGLMLALTLYRTISPILSWSIDVLYILTVPFAVMARPGLPRLSKSLSENLTGPNRVVFALNSTTIFQAPEIEWEHNTFSGSYGSVL